MGENDSAEAEAEEAMEAEPEEQLATGCIYDVTVVG